MPYCFLCKQWFGFLPDQPVNFSRGVASKLLLLIKDSVRVPCNYWPSTMNLHIEWIQTHHNVVVAGKNVDRPSYYEPHGNMLQYSTCAPIQTGYTNCGLLFFDIIAKFPKNYKHHQGFCTHKKLTLSTLSAFRWIIFRTNSVHITMEVHTTADM
jgi:hypothetical protein